MNKIKYSGSRNYRDFIGEEIPQEEITGNVFEDLKKVKKSKFEKFKNILKNMLKK